MLINEYKEHNKHLINEIKEKNTRITTLRDELEELHAAYGDAQKEIINLKNHNDILIKQVKRLERRSGKLGMDLLRCKNELRNPSPDEDVWKQFNKANRSGNNE